MLRTTWVALMAMSGMLALGCGDDGGGTGSDTQTGGDTDPSTGSVSDGTTTDPATTDDSSTTTDDPSTTTDDPSTTTDDPSTTDDSTGGTGSSGATVTGNVSRSVEPGGDNDGIGDAYLGLLVECDQNADTVASTTVLDADLSMDGSIVPFSIENVPDGTYYLTGFFDDNQNTDPNDPGPDLNDLASAMGLGPQCTEVTVAGADVSGVVLTFNFVVPF